MSWTWKDKSQGGLPLRYEPGNWGDILKGEWLCLFLQWWAARHRGAFKYVDPFCGQPDYVLTEPTRQRIEACGAPHYARLAAGDRLLSSASLVSAQARELQLRLEAYCSDAESDPLQALQPADLILFDPYDLFERWPEWNDALLERAEDTNVLLYLYNKSPRSASQFRQYRSWRRRWEGRALVIGRLPSDICLPRAWHEVWLVGPAAREKDLQARLQHATLELQRPLAEQGAWEVHCA